MDWNHFLCCLHPVSISLLYEIPPITFSFTFAKIKCQWRKLIDTQALLARLLYHSKSYFYLYLLNNNLPTILMVQAYKLLKDLPSSWRVYPRFVMLIAKTKLQNHFPFFISNSIAITSMLVLMVFCITSSMTMWVSYYDYSVLLS